MDDEFDGNESYEEEEIDTNKSLELHWVFGLNKDIFDGVHHLGDGERSEIFYVAGHIGVIYDYRLHSQRLLQGHTNAITCVCVSKDKRWIVTADAGHENMIVVWDSVKAIPIKTLFNPHAFGTQAIDISHNGMFIASLSYPYFHDEETDQDMIMKEQTLSIWQWTSTRDKPLYSSSIGGQEIGGEFKPLRHPQTLVRFHSMNYKLLVSNSIKNVIFWSWEESKLKFYSPPVSKNDFRTPVGEFTQSTFIPGTTMAATGTKHGEIVLWQQVESDKKCKSTDKRALKVVSVHKHDINFISTIDGKYIVTGGKDGYVRFFDYQLRLQAWFEEFDAGPIMGVSFQRTLHDNIFEEDNEELEEIDPDEIPDDEDDMLRHELDRLVSADGMAAKSSREKDRLEAENEGMSVAPKGQGKFKAPDFLVHTSLALVLLVKSDSFHSYEMESIQGTLLVQGQEGPIQSLSVHPKLPCVAISGLSGHLHLWDYEQKKVLSLTMFQNLLITCIDFDSVGKYLAVGCSNGTIKVLEVAKFEEIQNFRPSSSYVTKIRFSHDGKYFAFSDLDNCIGIFKYCNRDEDERKPLEWVYIGRYKAHKSGGDVGVNDEVNMGGNPGGPNTPGGGVNPKKKEIVSKKNTFNKLRIADFSFGVTPYGNVPRLMSIGEDRRLVEYDLRESSIIGGVKVKSIFKIGQNAHPTALLWTKAPNVTIKYKNEKSEYDCLLISNDHYKFLRYVTPDTGRDPICTKTFRCPAYGGPVTKMVLVNTRKKKSISIEEKNRMEEDKEKKGEVEVQKEEVEEEVEGEEEKKRKRRKEEFGKKKKEEEEETEPDLLAYCTLEQVVGLIHVPLDGNPKKMMGIVAHSGEIKDFCVSRDGKYLFTAGGIDHTMNMWKIDSSFLHQQNKVLKGISVNSSTEGEDVDLNEGTMKANKNNLKETSKRELSTFIELIEGGKGGTFFEEIKQYFFYAQIRSQGEVTTNERKISGEVPVAEVPSIIRALGFYATEYEIENLMNELRSILGYTKETGSDERELVDFDTFIRVYVNHKPIYMIEKKDIEEAFEEMGCESVSKMLSMDKLLYYLTTKGEKMTKQEVAKSIQELVGKNITWKDLASMMNADQFAKTILMFQEKEIS